ncbi:nectin-3-like isoform X2 [Pelodiscus sinensis]|uniref:nectin-3-like isoform X2 n=1 Tax=Pelodiscus sinensis TaxID=13735 RepID=UPI003F6C8CE2
MQAGMQAAAPPPARGGLSAGGAPSPALLGLWLLLRCGVLAGPIVDPHVTAVWGKNVTLKCIIEINGKIIQTSWEKVHGKSTRTIAVLHPEYGFSVQGEYQGRVSFKNYSRTNATIILNNISFSDSGEYVCKAVTFPLGNVQASTTVTVLVEPTVSLTKGPNSLIDGESQTVVAICTAATGKPAADIDWEGDLGEMESSSTSFPNETVTVVSQYKLKPTKLARGRRITCVVRHPALEKEMRYRYMLDVQYAPEVSQSEYDGNGFIGREHIQLRCSADAYPLSMAITCTSPLTYNYIGTYMCKVTDSIGEKSDQKTIYILDAPEVSQSGYDGNGFIGREHIQLRCSADAYPLSMAITCTRLDGQWHEGLMSFNNTLHFNSPLTYNYIGTYMCKVTDSIGEKSDQKTIYILVLFPSNPTTATTATTRPPTVPWHPSTDGIAGLATEPKLMHFPTSIQEENWGPIISSAVGGALFLILLSVLVGIICYRRRLIFRVDSITMNYISPSETQKESQIDVLQLDDVDSAPDIIKKEIKHPVNSLISIDDLEDPDEPQWNNANNINRYQEEYERPVDNYEGGALGMKHMGSECYDDSEEDFVLHIDGSIISRRERYL